MKYKLKDQTISLNFQSLQNDILEALKSSDKELSIAVYDENDIQTATAVIDVSGATLELDRIELTEQFKENNKNNPQAIVDQKNQILTIFTQALKEINQEIEELKKKLSPLVVKLLTEYRALFMQYPIELSELRRFIDTHENSEYKDVFARFIPEFSRLSTTSFQETLNNLYQEFISLAKQLNNPDLNEQQRNGVIENSKKYIAAQQQAVVRFFSQLQNLAMLTFLARELPKFEPAAKAWNEYAKQIEEENAESLAKLKEEASKRHQKEADDIYSNDERLQKIARTRLKNYIARFPEKYDEKTKDEIPITFLKHPGMRQSVFELLTTEDKIDPEEISKLPSLEKLVSLVNNNSLITDPALMDLYTHERIKNYSRVKSGQNFEGYNLQYLSINQFFLSSSNFKKADLANARLTNCRLFNADFSGADLSGTDFTGATLDDVQWGRAVFSEDTIMDWNRYGADIILSQLKAIGQAKDLNLAQKKAEAKNCINIILPNINSNKTLLKLVALIEGKHRDYAYLREEQAFWRFNQYGNTKTWSTIIGQIKEQLDQNVTKESKKSQEKREVYTGEEYKTFLKIMDEHRGRGFGPVTHSKFYDHLTEGTLKNIETMKISKK